jgi:hypothetical protein
LCPPWNAGTPGVGNVGPLKIQGLPVTCSARDPPRAVCCVAEGLRNRPDFRSWHIPEAPSAASDGRLLFQSGLRQAITRRVYVFTP